MFGTMCLYLMQWTKRGSAFHRLARRFSSTKQVTCDGWRINAHPYDNHTEYWMTLTGHPPEFETYSFLKNEISGKNIEFIDIGANCGIYSIPVSIFSGKDSVVYSFEPNPDMIARLRENVSIKNRKNIQIFPVAVGSQQEIITLYIPRHKFRELGQATMISPARFYDEIEVEVTVLQKEIPRRKPECDLRILKIDVEGFEDHAIFDFINESQLTDLPDILIIEVVHKAMWSRDLLSLLERRAYLEVDHIDGNSIFRRNRGK